jgi:hypothetical protein
MAKQHDYIPKGDNELLEFAQNLYAYVMKKYTAWSAPSPQEYLENPIDEYEHAVKMYQKPNRGTVDVFYKNEWKKTVTKELRTYIQGFLARNPKVPDEDRKAMRLPIRDTIPTKQEAPKTVPEIETITSTINQLGFRLRDYGARRWGKPAGVHSMQLVWDILTERPGDAGKLSHTETATTNPILLKFKEKDRGKRVYFAARWMNSKEEAGPWSDIESAVIP